MTTEHTDESPGSILTFGQSLSISGTGALQSVLVEAIDGPHDVVMDLSEVEQCDTASAQLIFAALQTAAKRGKRIRLAAISPAVTSTFAFLGLPLDQMAERRTPNPEPEHNAA